MKPRPKRRCRGCGKPMWSAADARRGHHGGPCDPARRGYGPGKGVTDKLGKP